MKTKTLLILLTILVILTTVLSGSLAYGEESVEEAFRQYEKAVDDYYDQQSLISIIKILFICGMTVIACIYLPKSIKKEKEASVNAVRDIVRTEFDHRIGVYPKLQSCENCGRTIGKLEKNYFFEDHIVCMECHKRLKDPQMRLLTRRPAQNGNSTQA